MNQITGQVLSVGQTQQIQGRDPQRPFLKREITIDCTRHDPVTGQRSPYDNTPCLEFAGDKVAELEGIQPGDIVTISFDIEGRRYTDGQGMARIYTRIRPYRIEKRQQPSQAPATAYQQPQQAVAPQQDFPPSQQPQFGFFGNNVNNDEPPF